MSSSLFVSIRGCLCLSLRSSRLSAVSLPPLELSFHYTDRLSIQPCEYVFHRVTIKGFVDTSGHIPYMRGGDRIFDRPERMIECQRFGVIDVQSGAGDRVILLNAAGSLICSDTEKPLVFHKDPAMRRIPSTLPRPQSG
jgi:hypothetical protein